MKYLITEKQHNKLKEATKDNRIKLIGKLVDSFYPTFNKEDATIVKLTKGGTHLAYYDKGNISPFFAKYWVYTRELDIDRELYMFIANSLGDDQTVWIIDWFNEEFGKDAESITFN